MSTKPKSFEELLALCGTPKGVSEAMGIPYITAQQMVRRRSVGIEHWPKLIRIAAEHGHVVTNDDLVEMALKRKAKAKAGQPEAQVA